jgi:hypothetical protein
MASARQSTSTNGLRRCSSLSTYAFHHNKLLTAALGTNFKETITVVVGADKQEFTVHKDTIRKRFPFVRAACSKRWCEGRASTVALPEHHPVVFHAYLQWAYFSSADFLALLNNAWKETKEFPCAEIEAFADAYEYLRTVRLRILSDYLCDKHCKNAVMDSLIRDMKLNSIR